MTRIADLMEDSEFLVVYFFQTTKPEVEKNKRFHRVCDSIVTTTPSASALPQDDDR